jgi:hypothetical protein
MILSKSERVKALINLPKCYEPNDLVEYSLQAVLEGEEQPYILELASLFNPDQYDIQTVYKKYNKELYLPKNLAVLKLVQDICQRIVDKMITPHEGAWFIGWNFYRAQGDPPELSIMLALASFREDCFSEEERETVSQNIIKEARKMLEPSFEINSLKER